ncbi:MAG: carbohydrate ABC transporter permease [Spirochaetales bacterium]|nr:carbohydrate ABC transporter permease [Spirochaetales bacterium]
MDNLMKKTLRTIFNILLISIFIMPFLWMVITSIKTVGQTLQTPPSFWVKNPQWENFVTAVTTIPFFHYLLNSLIVTASTLIIQFLTIIPAAYAFARIDFKGKNILFGITLSTMMIPAQLIFLPVFVMFSKWHLINNVLSIILLNSATNAFGIFMLRQTFKQVPEEIIEAALMDEARQWQIIFKIMLPIARPTIMTLGLITFINSWNDYFWPMILTTTDAARTLPVGIAGLNSGEASISYNILMAGIVLLLLPIIIAFLASQKQITKAFTYTGIK